MVAEPLPSQRISKAIVPRVVTPFLHLSVFPSHVRARSRLPCTLLSSPMHSDSDHSTFRFSYFKDTEARAPRSSGDRTYFMHEDIHTYVHPDIHRHMHPHVLKKLIHLICKLMLISPKITRFRNPTGKDNAIGANIALQGT